MSKLIIVDKGKDHDQIAIEFQEKTIQVFIYFSDISIDDMKSYSMRTFPLSVVDLVNNDFNSLIDLFFLVCDRTKSRKEQEDLLLKLKMLHDEDTNFVNHELIKNLRKLSLDSWASFQNVKKVSIKFIQSLILPNR